MMTAAQRKARQRAFDTMMAAQCQHLDALQSRQGLASTRDLALDQLTANIHWLMCGYPEPHMGSRKLYDFLQKMADIVIQPDLVQSE